MSNNQNNPQDNVPVKSVEYDKCPKTPIELLADIDVYRALRSPQAAIKAIELHTEYCSAPLKDRITELEAALINIQSSSDPHNSEHEIFWRIAQQALNPKTKTDG